MALKVTIAEVQRAVVKQLGINVTGAFNGDGRSASGPTSRRRRRLSPLRSLRRAGGDRRRASRAATFIDPGDAAGARRDEHDPHARRADADRGLRRDGGLPRRRRVPGYRSSSQDNGDRHRRVQAVRREARLHAGGALGRPHQPEGADRGERDLPGVSCRSTAIRRPQHPSARRNHRRAALRRLLRDRRPGPGEHRRAASRLSRAAEAADPRRALLVEGLPRPTRPSW